MEILKACFVVNDDLLDFTLDEENENRKTIFKGASASSSLMTTAVAGAAFRHDTRSGLFSEFVEEELEWLSNRDAFPSVDTCFGILSDNPELISNHHSPVSVLENSSGGNAASSCSGVLKVPGNFPVRPRSKRQRRKRDQQLWLNRVNFGANINLRTTMKGSGASMGRRCLHCLVEKTPQWRAGPMGPKTLCNACGVRFKSGRLVPEYRPANSPTFSTALHSNSHRKVVEMRRQKYIGAAMGDGIMVDEACGYRVG